MTASHERGSEGQSSFSSCARRTRVIHCVIFECIRKRFLTDLVKLRECGNPLGKIFAQPYT